MEDETAEGRQGPGKKQKRKIKSLRQRIVRKKRRGQYWPEMKPSKASTSETQDDSQFSPKELNVNDGASTSEGNQLMDYSALASQENSQQLHLNEGTSTCAGDQMEDPSPTSDYQEESQETYQPPDVELIRRLLALLDAVLLDNWKAIADSKSIHLLLLSNTQFIAVQREIIVSFDSAPIQMAVHCYPLPADIIQQITSNLPEPEPLEESTLNTFPTRCFLLMRNMKQFELCPGANHMETESIWQSVPDSYSDQNPYFESYGKTCRSIECHRLKPFGKNQIRCAPCAKIMRTLRERAKFVGKETPSPTTANKYLNLKQACNKLKSQHEEMRKKDKRIDYLEKKVKNSLQTDGVELDEEISLNFSEILCNSSSLSEVQKIFLQQQLEASTKADARGHRWHPLMIRLALRIKMISTSAYDALRDSGMIKLPCKRTLFNYTSFIKPEEGVSQGLISFVKQQVKNLGHAYQQYHALLVDEMHISKNLVYRSSDGKLVGYCHLDEVDNEIAQLENHLKAMAADADNIPQPAQPALASKMLAFMVKGLCSRVKCVVASYPCSEMNKEMLYVRSWNVISQLEAAGIKVLCYVCDGHPVNRGFFNLHEPLTPNTEVVFDTINICSPERRPLYFISDVCHLIKTARNCFHNSGREGKKSRCMQINGQFIEWKTIVRLYLQFKDQTFRRSYKLNPQNVFINSYSAMKVKFAAQVLSDTVASDLKRQNWPNIEETIKFIRMFNKFFDCLNGAHSSQHIKTRNKNLAPYTDPNDERFEWLEGEFLKYLKDWKKQAESSGELPKDVEKMLLAHQTIEGIVMSIRSIRAAITFLLKEGAQFVMARAFSQDPLEQHFSRQRAGFGGSSNPNASQFPLKAVSVALQGQMKGQVHGANVEGEDEQMEDLNEPLPKAPNKRKSKRGVQV